MKQVAEPQNGPEESPTKYMLAEGCDEYTYECYSPDATSFPKQQKKTSKKRKAAKKPKKETPTSKKIKREPLEGNVQRTLDDWLSKKESTVWFNEKVLVKTIEPKSETFTVVPLKGILKKQPSPPSKNARRQVAF